MQTGSKLINGLIQILIAEEHPLYAESLRALLEAEPDFRVAGVASGLDAAIQMSKEKEPDLILLNVDKSPNKVDMAVLEELQIEGDSLIGKCRVSSTER